MDSLTVRQAVLADLDALAPLFDHYRQFYERPGDLDAAREFLRARFDHGESVIFIAHDADVPVGFTQIYPSFSSILMERIFILNDIFVTEQGRRKGVGLRLMIAAVEYAKSMGAVRLTLSTAITNHTAQALYESAGWELDEQFIYYQFIILA